MFVTGSIQIGLNSPQSSFFSVLAQRCVGVFILQPLVPWALLYAFLCLDLICQSLMQLVEVPFQTENFWPCKQVSAARMLCPTSPTNTTKRTVRQRCQHSCLRLMVAARLLLVSVRWCTCTCVCVSTVLRARASALAFFCLLPVTFELGRETPALARSMRSKVSETQ